MYLQYCLNYLLSKYQLSGVTLCLVRQLLLWPLWPCCILCTYLVSGKILWKNIRNNMRVMTASYFALKLILN